MELATAPTGSGEHPVALTVITASDLEKSRAFYERVHGWQMSAPSGDISIGMTPGEQAVALRTGEPAGFPAMVPFLYAPDVDRALEAAVAAGAVVETPRWVAPTLGEMARFRAPGGTVYGFVSAKGLRPMEPMPVPLGPGKGPRVKVGAISSLELYASDFERTAEFFGALGWGTRQTIPRYMAFDTGAGVAGVFQSHTPAQPAVAYVSCADVEAKLRDVEAAGGKRLCDPMSMPDMGTFGYFLDASGTAGGLIGPG